MAIAVIETVVVPFAIFKLLRQPELRNWCNVAITLVAIVGSFPGALLILGVWALGGDWT
jgi:hypothetical protein